MKLVDRYILRESAEYALLGFGIFTFILLTPEVLRLSELVARETASLLDTARLFLSLLPGKLVWSIPLAVLTGLLVGISRLAADSEAVALQAAGIGFGRLLRPTMAFAGVGCVLTIAASAWWGPWAARSLRSLQEEWKAGHASFEIRPRVFEERFPNLVLYIQDTVDGGSRWQGVFLADLTDRNNPKITLAASGIPIPQADQDKLRLHLLNGSSHELVLEGSERYSVSTFAQSDLAIALPASNNPVELRASAELGLPALWRASQQGDRWRSTRADFHRRLALPASCLLFGLVAFPLGLLAERSGRAAGFILALLVAISYYFLFLLGDRLAREGDLIPWLGVWLPNLALVLVGAALWLRLRRPTTGALPWRSLAVFHPRRSRTAPRGEAVGVASSGPPPAGPLGSRLPRTLDLYAVRGALFYSLTLLVLLLALFELFTLLEMVDDIAARQIPWQAVARFLWFQLPQALYWMLPLAWLLGILVELSLLSKRNELVAVKAAGISLYRIAFPLVLVGLLCTGLLFLLDNNYLPYANQQREALLDEIKGRPPRTFFRAGRRWVFGEDPRIYYYAFFDPGRAILGRLAVFELNPTSFAIGRRLYARRAEWNAGLNSWVLQEGWMRDFSAEKTVGYQAFTVASFPELVEEPDYFRKEVRESTQMNWRELGAYIEELHQSGFDVTRLQVQWHKKFSFPAISMIMVLLGFPFALTMGRRGAVGGLAVGIGLGVAFWVFSSFFEALGNLALLPPSLAAWGPDLFFAFAGVYLLLQVET